MEPAQGGLGDGTKHRQTSGHQTSVYQNDMQELVTVAARVCQSVHRIQQSFGKDCKTFEIMPGVYQRLAYV